VAFSATSNHGSPPKQAPSSEGGRGREIAAFREAPPEKRLKLSDKKKKTLEG